MNNQNQVNRSFPYPYPVFPYYYPQSQPVYHPSFSPRHPHQQVQENVQRFEENQVTESAGEYQEATEAREAQFSHDVQQEREMPSSDGHIQGMLPMQQSYIENILRLNRGKRVVVYMTFPDKNQQTFTGNIEAAGRDHIILSDPDSNERYLLLMIYLDYVLFEERINYHLPQANPNANFFTTSSPR